ncbi:MAG: hypothetical protein R2873_34590 [Caldilineaceae bacterium]
MDTESHRTKLISLRRCPVCASLPSKGVQQTRSVCNAVTFGSQSDLDRYLTGVNKQLPVTLVVCFLLGLLPVLGLLPPGIIYYRFTLVSKVKRYMPRHIGFQAKRGVRILNGVLILLQPIPFVGAFLLMLMCYSNYVIYRGLLEREGRWVWRMSAVPPYAAMEQPRPVYTQPLLSRTSQTTH